MDRITYLRKDKQLTDMLVQNIRVPLPKRQTNK